MLTTLPSLLRYRAGIGRYDSSSDSEDSSDERDAQRIDFAGMSAADARAVAEALFGPNTPNRDPPQEAVAAGQATAMPQAPVNPVTGGPRSEVTGLIAGPSTTTIDRTAGQRPAATQQPSRQVAVDQGPKTVDFEDDEDSLGRPRAGPSRFYNDRRLPPLDQQSGEQRRSEREAQANLFRQSSRSYHETAAALARCQRALRTHEENMQVARAALRENPEDIDEAIVARIRRDAEEMEAATRLLQEAGVRRERQQSLRQSLRRPTRGRDVQRLGMRDADDGVRRCLDCNWEIHNGRCENW